MFEPILFQDFHETKLLLGTHPKVQVISRKEAFRKLIYKADNLIHRHNTLGRGGKIRYHQRITYT